MDLPRRWMDNGVILCFSIIHSFIHNKVKIITHFEVYPGVKIMT